MMAQMNSQTNIPTALSVRDDDVVAGGLTSTVDQQGSSTESLNGVEGDGGGADVDEGGDEGNQERVVDGSKSLAIGHQ